MRHLIVHKIGPINHADLEIKKANVIIGPQSSGKSCILKIASFCSWIEKRIELTQDYKSITSEYFRINLERYHKLTSYFQPDSYIEYESDYMKFIYRFDIERFKFNWKERWDYHRSQIAYIPSERNLVAAIPNWYQVNFDGSNIQDFLAQWEDARKSVKNNLEILNLGFSYHYDDKTKEDLISLPQNASETYISFGETSSGLQSVVPLVVFLNYIHSNIDKPGISDSALQRAERDNILNEIYQKLISNGRKLRISNQYGKITTYLSQIDGHMLTFLNKEEAQKCREVYLRYIKADHYDLFVEEPEDNLFPPTQKFLIDWMLDMIYEHNLDTLFVATHSPYVLNSFIQRENLDDVAVFITDTSRYTVKMASEHDIREMYDYNGDFFFGIESLL